MQAFTSKATSINSSKAPAVYGMKKAVALMTGKAVIDVGGGRFDTAARLTMWGKSPPPFPAGR